MQLAEQDIRKRLATVRLPAMPQVLARLLALCQHRTVGVAEAAQLVAQDPGMAGTVLGVAYSSAYRNDGRDIGIMQALSTIGDDMFRTLLLNESVRRVFGDPSEAKVVEEGGMRDFWKRSLTAALAARDIAQRMSYPYPDEAYLAGLLHDIGRLALLGAAPVEYAASFLAPDDAKLCWTEQRTLHITHGEAGAWLIERWRLDSFLADSVLYHHEPVGRLESAHPLIRIGLLARLLAGAEPTDQEAVQAGLLCGLEADVLADIRSAAAGRMKEAAAGLDIDLEAQLPAQAGAAPLQDASRLGLSDQVRNMLMTTNAERTFGRQQGQEALLETISRSMRLLFGLDDVLILLRSGDGAFLRGAPGGQGRQRLADFSIPLGGEGMLSRTAAQCQVAFIRRDGALLAVGEEQLLNMLGAESLACVPLEAEGLCQGVAVGGVCADRIGALEQRRESLRAFGIQAGAALLAAGNARAALSSQAAGIAEEFREAARKVAHEVNNPLSIIKNYLSILDGKLRRQEPAVAELSILNEEIDRVGQIIHGLADLRPSTGEVFTDVGRVAREVVRLFKESGSVPAAVHIAIRLPARPSAIDGNPDLLKQILMNLIKNAIEAMPDGGDIEIADHGRINRDGRLYVELSIRDSGPGIAPDVLAHLFAPGHSTKDGARRGLGLSIVHSLVSQLHGTILCRSGGTGTTFQLLLPAPPAGAGQALAADNT
ncbi:MAG: HDOD domain-containing protein [Noviherbaspirillum sp.]